MGLRFSIRTGKCSSSDECNCGSNFSNSENEISAEGGFLILLEKEDEK